jgi:hypothetical protein
MIKTPQAENKGDEDILLQNMTSLLSKAKRIFVVFIRGKLYRFEVRDH